MILAQNQTSNLYNTQYTNPVRLPGIFKDDKNEIRIFQELENPLKINIELILQCITPDANLKPTPTLKSYNSAGVNFSILNYTKINLYFNQELTLYAENDKIDSFTADNCRLLAYHTSNHPKIICIEQKDDVDDLPGARFFIENHQGKYIYKDAWFLNTPQHQTLLKQIPFQIADVNTFINTNDSMRDLIQKIHKKAVLKNQPTLTQFRALKNKPLFTILNHTDEEIFFNIFYKIYINNHDTSKNITNNCQIIAYHMPDRKDVICIEQYDVLKTRIYPRLFTKLSWKNTNKSDCNSIFIDVRKNWVIKTLWSAIFDNECVFFQNGVPSDIIREIALVYFNVLNSTQKVEQNKKNEYPQNTITFDIKEDLEYVLGDEGLIEMFGDSYHNLT